MLKALVNCFFVLADPNRRFSEKFAFVWLSCVVLAAVVGLAWMIVDSAAQLGWSGFAGIAVGVITAWAVITWLNAE